MKMEVLEINALWLKQASTRMKVPSEALLNGILNHLRTGDGEGPGESLEEWLAAAGTTHLLAEEILANLRETRGIVVEAARGTQLYIARIESERNPLGPAGTRSTESPKPV